MSDGDDGAAAVSGGVRSTARNGRGRRWSDVEKAAIVAESLEAGVVVTALAGRLGIRPEQIHGWRKDMREGRLARSSRAAIEAPVFAPVVVETIDEAPMTRSANAAPIELETAGVVIRLREGADVHLAAMLVRALRDERA